MSKLLKSLDPLTLAALDGLTLRARQIVEGFVAGSHRSPFRGVSVEFSEHRDYVPGDDLRHVDWKAFARTDKLFVKQFVDETNLHAYLILDSSASMSYQGAASGLSKFQYAQCLVAGLAWLLIRNGDAAGLALADADIQKWIAAASHAKHWDRLIETMDEANAQSETDLGAALRETASRLQHRSVVLVISDFLDDVSRVLDGVEQLRFAQHDVVLLQVLDRDELEFPFDERVEFQGLESDLMTQVESKQIRQQYLQLFRMAQDQFVDHARNLGASYQCVVSDEDLGTVLNEFLTSRNVWKGDS